VNNGRVSSRALFAIVYTTSISSVYFALGVVAHRALALTPVVFLLGGLFFALGALTYAEGASLHRERGGSSVFARYAFNELVSFVSGWAIVLDYAILVAVTALAATSYLAAFWSPLGHGALEVVVAGGIVAAVAAANVIGLSPRRLQRRVWIALGDLAVQALLIVLGAAFLLHPAALVDSIDLGRSPSWSNVIFALTIATVAFTGLEAAASLSGEVITTNRGLRRLLSRGTAVIVAVYVGIAFVAVNAVPIRGGVTALGDRYVKAPLIGVTKAFDPGWLSDALMYLVAGTAVVGLVAAANSSMLGLSRVGYALATNRQVPSLLAQLHPRRGTPFVLILIAAAISIALVIPTDVELLVGIYAFGALLAFTVAHASVVALRFRERHRDDGVYTMPLSMTVGGVDVPIPAVVGALASATGLVSLLVLHAGARWVGVGWMLGGLVLYVAYRRSTALPLLTRVTVPERALREDVTPSQFGSLLVPIFGQPLDDDIVQTAGRLAGEERDDLDEQGAMIEAIWVFEIPVALPLDAPLPDAQWRRAKEALARAKKIGEEYEGVEVKTATVRARQAGQAIVEQARRRGVEAIVLAAEEPSRIRGGALLGGAGGPLDNFVGDVTKYVIRKAPCRVILTAPAAETSFEPPSQSVGSVIRTSANPEHPAGSPR
jgi:APA family basic amino acid/polyamine antiporter